MENVRISEINIDRSYQRELDEAQVEAIIENFSWDLFGALTLSRRANGKLYVTDGQHRWMAADGKGYSNTKVPCHIIEGLTVKGEAELFLRLNKNRRAVALYDRFRARQVAEEPKALEIASIVNGEGLEVARAASANRISAIKSVELVHDTYRNLRKVLRTVRSWYNGDPGVYRGAFIKDIGMFMFKMEAMGMAVDSNELADSLRKYAPDQIMASIKQKRGVPLVSHEDAVMSVYSELYNRGRRKNRIPTKATKVPAPA